MSEKTNKKEKNGEYTVPDYSNIPLTAQKVLDSIISDSQYSYDVKSEPLYKQYADMYKQQASLAAQDVFGLASALTGGYGNSYAATQSAKAAAEIYEQIPLKARELEEDAYSRHLKETESKYDILSALKLIDGLKKDGDDASFDRAKFFAEYGDTSELEKLGVDLTALKREELTDIAEVFAKYGDYSLLKKLGVNTSDRETEDRYNRLLLAARYNKY